MINNPCEIYDYNSNEYDSCVKDVVYEAAQDEWIMLDPRFPNLKGVTPDKIDEIIQIFAEESQKLREYCIGYLQHVMVYDRDDIFKMCINLGEQIEKKYPGKLHDTHSIFVTTPRGGHEVLSIFAYANNLDKLQIPSHIRSLSKIEIETAIEVSKFPSDNISDLIHLHKAEQSFDNMIKHIEKGNYPVIPDIWLNASTTYSLRNITTVFIIDDIITSGQQMHQAYTKVSEFFGDNIKVIPIVLIKRKNIEEEYGNLRNTIYDTKTLGIYKWNKAQQEMKLAETGQTMSIGELEEVFKIYNSLITVRFPWGSPDGESDRIITKLYEGRRGLDRIERKQERCILEPSQCELK